MDGRSENRQAKSEAARQGYLYLASAARELHSASVPAYGTLDQSVSVCRVV